MSKHIREKRVILLTVLVVSILVLASCSSGPSTPTTTTTATTPTTMTTITTTTPTTSVTTTTTTTTLPGNVDISLVAQDLAFDKSTITIPAGAEVTVNFNNRDSGIPHNFAVYNNSSGSVTIYKGQVITGVATIVYTFTAPTTPGTYFFRCDTHPFTMTGSFIVQ